MKGYSAAWMTAAGMVRRRLVARSFLFYENYGGSVWANLNHVIKGTFQDTRFISKDYTRGKEKRAERGTYLVQIKFS